jgi:phosphatidate cytidylyltransferase
VLKQRLITAAILLPLVIAGIVWLPDMVFALFFAVFAIIGSWEWTKFMRVSSVALRLLYVAFVSLIILGCWFYVVVDPKYSEVILSVAVTWWILAFLLVVVYPKGSWFRKNSVITGSVGVVVLVPTWLAIVSLRNEHSNGVEMLLYLLALIAVADSGAYFGGRKWGKNKLAPQVSPGKSWEGVASGLICVAVIAILFSYLAEFQNSDWANTALFIGISLVTAIFSVLGDLAESFYKREVGLKDSGSILPGHGGVLDRIDSITAAAPIFLACLGWFLI